MISLNRGLGDKEISKQAGEFQGFALQNLRHLPTYLPETRFTVWLCARIDKQLVSSLYHNTNVLWGKIDEEMLYSTSTKSLWHHWDSTTGIYPCDFTSSPQGTTSAPVRADRDL